MKQNCKSLLKCRLPTVNQKLSKTEESFENATTSRRGATSSSFPWGGKFSWTFIRWRHRSYSTVVQLFRKRSQICSFRNISENDNLLVLIRPVTRGAKPTLKNFSPRWKNVLDILQLKNLGPFEKTLRPPWCPKLVTGLLLIKMQTERSGQSKN